MGRWPDPAAGSRNHVRCILPVGGIDGGGNRRFSARHLIVRRTSGMPKLGEHMTALRVDRCSDLFPSFDLFV
jgi:hypothetical protein